MLTRFFSRKLNIGLHSAVYRSITFNFKFDETIKHYFFYTDLNDFLNFIQDHNGIRNHNILHPFSPQFSTWFGCSVVCCHNTLVCLSSCCY